MGAAGPGDAARGGAAEAPPIVNIAGERVVLGPLRRDLIPAYRRWVNDFHVQRTFDDRPGPKTLASVTAWFEREATATDRVRFVIYAKDTWGAIGTTTLFDLDDRNRAASFGILIGEAFGRGRGYGTEATRLLLDYAFTAVGLHSVMLTTDSFNLAAQRAYAKAGFKEFGRRREAVLLAGQLYNMIYMDCLSSEFTSLVLGRVFVPDEPRANAARRDDEHAQ